MITIVPLCRDGTKNVRQNSFHINGMGQIRDVYMYGEITFNDPVKRPFNSP